MCVQAAAHIHRYLTLDENILLETTADSSTGKSSLNTGMELVQWVGLVCEWRVGGSGSTGNTSCPTALIELPPTLPSTLSVAAG